MTQALLTSMLAAATQEDVFKSIEDHVEGPGDSRTFIALVLTAAIAVLLLAILNRRRQRKEKPEAENNPNRLVREVAKEIGLLSADLKRLKAMQRKAGIQSPLTLMLCPSVLGKVMKEGK